MSCEYVVDRAAANLPQSTTEDIFEVSGGKVLLLGIVGEVTTSIQAQTTDSYVHVGGPVTWNSDLNGVAAGSQLGGVNSDNVGQVVYPIAAEPVRGNVVLKDGHVITFQCTASSTGAVAWKLWYRPLDPGAKVSAV